MAGRAVVLITDEDLPTAAEILPIQNWVRKSNEYMEKATEAIAKLRQKYPRLQKSRDEFNMWLQANFGYSISTYSKQNSILSYTERLDDDAQKVFAELPWTTRYELTKAPADEVSHLIGEGTITKVTEVKDVREAVASITGKPASRPKPAPQITEAVNTAQGMHVCACMYCGRTFPFVTDMSNLGTMEASGLVTQPGTASTIGAISPK